MSSVWERELEGLEVGDSIAAGKVRGAEKEGSLPKWQRASEEDGLVPNIIFS